MDSTLEQLIWERAGSRCEYCRMAQVHDRPGFEIDHIIALVHGGLTEASNLALACFLDNSYKGPHLAGIDPKTRRIERLFHPRRHSWQRHFRWQGPTLVGRTPMGRATIAVLRINLPHRMAHRQTLLDEGLFPPPLL
jgi:hypothetical protein